MKQQPKIRLIALLLCLCLIVVLSSSLFFVVGHQGHVCHDPHCPVCMILQTAHEFLNLLGTMLLVALAALLGMTQRGVKMHCAQRFFCFARTLQILKIKLNN